MSCGCGCGESPQGREFLPGHDQRLRAQLEAATSRITEKNGLLAMRDLVRLTGEFKEGRLTPNQFVEAVKAL